VKIRLLGTPEECDEAERLLGQALDVTSQSQQYPSRGDSALVRVYMEVRV
jgi:hypothetical protein